MRRRGERPEGEDRDRHRRRIGNRIRHCPGLSAGDIGTGQFSNAKPGHKMSSDGLFGLRDRVAVVTGGNGGIGLGIAEGLAGAGACVVIAARPAYGRVPRLSPGKNPPPAAPARVRRAGLRRPAAGQKTGCAARSVPDAAVSNRPPCAARCAVSFPPDCSH